MSTAMAFDVVNEVNVYLCTGNPLPQTIQNITKWMLNKDYQEAYEKVSSVQIEQGLALQDILRDVNTYLLAMRLNDDVLIDLYKKLSEIEYRLDMGANDKIQLGALISAFQLARETISAQVDG
eukprot:TRINITY_DN2687_c0_g1_i5.p1 TRINITY_DN2687_c0_g1~~TRINITY_DN2687_c0_g1_i5.p1  ORF type:complete len:123 (-),score=24.49 TRINITY_DN2687_c0_g1_i5:214-582(-)